MSRAAISFAGMPVDGTAESLKRQVTRWEHYGHLLDRLLDDGDEGADAESEEAPPASPPGE